MLLNVNRLRIFKLYFERGLLYNSGWCEIFCMFCFFHQDSVNNVLCACKLLRQITLFILYPNHMGHTSISFHHLNGPQIHHQTKYLTFVKIQHTTIHDKMNQSFIFINEEKASHFLWKFKKFCFHTGFLLFIVWWLKTKARRVMLGNATFCHFHPDWTPN